jgi:4-amino-4-deoxy-L-arabinose transferase-like glycosyltransferase
MRERIAKLAPWVVALFFGLLGLREFHDQNLPSDAPNHLLNGAFLLDFFRSGQLTKPLAFATQYYGHLPAITIPFHPPLFALFESLWFAVFGVHVEVGRLVIAFTVVISGVLFYLVIRAAGLSVIASLTGMIALFSLQYFTYLAGNIMLEYPLFVVTLAALYQLRKMETGFPLGAALAFAVLASAALWTKQQAVFLGLVPFFYIAISRRWNLLFNKGLWIATILFGITVIVFTTFTSKYSGGSGGAQEIPPQAYVAKTFVPRLLFYIRNIFSTFGTVAGPWVVGSFFVLAALRLAGRARSLARLDVTLAWAPASFAILFLTGHLDQRYLFLVYPPLVILGVAALSWLSDRVLPARFAFVPLAVVAVYSLSRIPGHPARLHVGGPAEAVDGLLEGGPHRVLYCGSVMAGNFIFKVRTLDPDRQNWVLRGDKFGTKLSPAEVDDIAHRFGVDRIVIPKAATPQPCDSVPGQEPATMQLIREVPMPSTAPNWQGNIYVYRFTNPSPNPENTLKIRTKTSKDMEVSF